MTRKQPCSSASCLKNTQTLVRNRNGSRAAFAKKSCSRQSYTNLKMSHTSYSSEQAATDLHTGPARGIRWAKIKTKPLKNPDFRKPSFNGWVTPYSPPTNRIQRFYQCLRWGISTPFLSLPRRTTNSQSLSQIVNIHNPIQFSDINTYFHGAQPGYRYVASFAFSPIYEA